MDTIDRRIDIYLIGDLICCMGYRRDVVGAMFGKHLTNGFLRDTKSGINDILIITADSAEMILPIAAPTIPESISRYIDIPQTKGKWKHWERKTLQILQNQSLITLVCH